MAVGVRAPKTSTGAWLAFACLCLAGPAAAIETLGEGMAAIVGGDTRAARAQAIRAALSEAAAFRGMRLESTQETDRYQLTVDKIRIEARAKINGYQIVDEQNKGDLYAVRLRADVVADDGAGAVITPSTREISLRLGWTLHETDLGGGTYRLVLTRKLIQPTATGGDGEALLEVRRHAEQLLLDKAYANYSIDRYSESQRERVLWREKIVEARLSFGK